MESFPLRYRSVSFNEYITEDERMSKVVEFMKSGKSAVIYGPNGTGKTMLAFCSIRHQLEKGKKSTYVLASDFFNEIRRSFNSKDPADVVDKLRIG